MYKGITEGAGRAFKEMSMFLRVYRVQHSELLCQWVGGMEEVASATAWNRNDVAASAILEIC